MRDSERYAWGTSVKVEKSMADIRRWIDRFGGEGFAYMEHADGTAWIGFAADGVTFKIPVPMGIRVQTAAGEQRELKRRWRVLEHHIKAAMIAVVENVGTPSQVFMRYAVLPDGRTMDETFTPQLAEMNKSGLLPSFDGPLLLSAASE